MKKKRKVLGWTAGILAASLLAADLLFSNYVVSFALGRGVASGADVAPQYENSQEAQSAISANWGAAEARGRVWAENAAQEAVSLVSEDGLTLRGTLFPPPAGGHRWVIMAHGYTSRKESNWPLSCRYAEEGYGVLLPDLRAHGESQGDYVGMGWLDRKDMLLWIDLLLERDPAAEIVLQGISMGGATVMMTAGETLPSNVKAVVEDCGYTSVWDIFSDEFQYLFHLPDFPILYTASGIAKLRAGYSFQEASTLEQVKKTRLPILFIHGTADTFVRPEMARILYEVCPKEKELYLAEGAGHGQAFSLDPERYCEAVFSFLDRVW